MEKEENSVTVEEFASNLKKGIDSLASALTGAELKMRKMSLLLCKLEKVIPEDVLDDIGFIRSDLTESVVNKIKEGE
jgi:hypothetical protein